MIDNETQLIFMGACLDSPDEVPFEAVIERLETSSAPELRVALQEMYLIAAGMARQIQAYANEEIQDEGPWSYGEIVETHFAILEAGIAELGE